MIEIGSKPIIIGLYWSWSTATLVRRRRCSSRQSRADAMRAACPRCRQQSPMHLSAKDWNRRITDETFDYYRCAACGIVFLSPVPRDIGKYYPTAYYGIPASIADLVAVAELERYKIELVQRYATRGRLLEIGPATAPSLGSPSRPASTPSPSK